MHRSLRELINEKDYDKTVEQASMILDGNIDKLVSNLKKEMKSYAKKMEFEKAKEIRDKIDKININIDISSSKPNDNESDVIKALISLGFSNNEAIKSLSKIENKENMSVEDLISLALRSLSSI